MPFVMAPRNGRRNTGKQLFQACGMVLGFWFWTAGVTQAATNSTTTTLVELQLQKPSVTLPSGYQTYLKHGQLWQGEAQLQGQKWWLGALESPENGASAQRSVWRFFLQPVQAPGLSGTNPPWIVSPSQKMTLNNQAYRVNWEFGGAGPTARLNVKFAEDHPKLGDLRVEEDDIRRLHLFGNQQVLIENPGPIVRLPADSYSMIQVTVGKTNHAARFETRLFQNLVVSATNTAVLRAGGPLANQVTTLWRGRSLRMDYQLLGAQGHTYRPLDTSQPPRFTIRYNGRTIAAGTFEFG